MNDSSVIYRAIVTSKFRTEKMQNFHDSIGDGSDKSSLYITFGRSTPWSDNENEVGFAPPYPIDDTQGVVDMWTNMMGSVKVIPSMLDAIVPRKDWGDIRYPNPKNFQIGEIVVVNSAPYNATEVGAGWLVYRVLDIPSQGTCSIQGMTTKDECIKLGGKWTSSTDSFAPPRGRGDAISDQKKIDTGDGYIWEYLYEIPPDVSINRCTNEYIVVPWPEEVAEDPQRWGFQNNLTWQQNDFNIIYRVKAYTIRFKAYFDSVYFPDAALPGNSGFRQIAVIVNPLEKKSLPSDPNVKAEGLYYNPHELERHSGEMIYMENRAPIIMAMDQTEEINIIFEF